MAFGVVALMVKGFGGLMWPVAAFGELKLQELTLGRTPLDGVEETYAVLSRIPTLTKLNLSNSMIKALPEGEPCSPNASGFGPKRHVAVC